MAGRKMMSKEVTSTTIKVAKIEVVNGTPKAVNLPDEVIIGNVSIDHAQRILNKKFGEPVTILELFAETKIYEMAVEDFIRVAQIKE